MTGEIIGMDFGYKDAAGYMLIGGKRVATVDGISVVFKEFYDHWTKPLSMEKITVSGNFSVRTPGRRWRKTFRIFMNDLWPKPSIKRPSRGYAKHVRRQKASH